MSSRFADGSFRSVDAIIPALNEERTVGEVVRAIKASAFVGEVIVVDDGSVDGTSEAASKAGARVVRLARNSGKGAALLAGVSASSAEVFFFCDADFIGLLPSHIDRLLEPVLEKRLVMCTGLRDRGSFVTLLIKHLPLLSGERALERRVIEAVPPRFFQGFRVEMALNYACRVRGWRYGSLTTSGVRQVRKMQKVGFWRGFAAYAEMIGEIVDALVRVRLAKREFLHV